MTGLQPLEETALAGKLKLFCSAPITAVGCSLHCTESGRCPLSLPQAMVRYEQKSCLEMLSFEHEFDAALAAVELVSRERVP